LAEAPFCIQDCDDIAIPIERKGSMAQVSDGGFCQIGSQMRYEKDSLITLGNKKEKKSIYLDFAM